MTTNQLEHEAEIIATNLSTASLYRSFYVDPRLFENCNARFSEKQIKRIDENFHDYSLGTRFRLNMPVQRPPRRLRYLIQKSFSGDVSGDIGEALFAYFMIYEMQVNPSLIGHLRPEKIKGFLSPDFVVWDNSLNLSRLMQKPSFPRPLLGEVKGSTGSIATERIYRALLQLRRLILGQALVGLLFLAMRNEVRQGYDAYVVRVET
jgi:hypothetical protein